MSATLADALDCNPAPFAMGDVAEVVAEWSSGEDEPDFAWLIELTDGRWAAATGWHDYTGWDCRSGFTASIHATRDEAIRLGFTQNDRENLGLALPDDPAGRGE